MRPAVPSRSSSQPVSQPTLFATLKTRRATLQFHLGDCLKVLPAFGEASIDAVVTSPPYNLGVRYSTYDDQLPREEYLQWTNRWAAAVTHALQPKGSLFLNVGHKPTDPWVAMDVAQTVRRHLHLQNLVHWVKSIAIDRDAAGAAAGLDRDLAVGHFKPINSDRFLNDCHEFIFHFTPSGRTPIDRLAIGVSYQDASNITRWHAAAGGRRCRGNTWFVPYETIQSREKDRPHPATFPPRIPEYCLRLHGVERLKLVADPFVGLGSTAIASAALGVSFVGIDLDPAYLDEAVRRTELALRNAGEPFSVEEGAAWSAGGHRAVNSGEQT